MHVERIVSRLFSEEGALPANRPQPQPESRPDSPGLGNEGKRADSRLARSVSINGTSAFHLDKASRHVYHEANSS